VTDRARETIVDVALAVGAFVIFVVVLFVATGCGVPPTPPRTPVPAVDVVGDSTLFGAQLAVAASLGPELVGARGMPASDPVLFAPSIEWLDAPRVLWVFVGTNGVAAANLAAIEQVCATRRCMVATQGVVAAWDDALVGLGLPVCDMTTPVYRPDGIHPDFAGSLYLAQRVRDCTTTLEAS